MKTDSKNRWPGTRSLAICLLTAIFAIAGFPTAWAAKPPKPPPPATSTIYWNGPGDAQWNMWTMNPDGNNKQYLCPNVCGEPSRLLHGGMRWFLEVRSVGTETYPDGSRRRELFAVRQDELEVQLTDQSDLQHLGRARWAPGDAAISWIAQRWEGETVVESGIYAADITFDDQGQIAGVVAQPDAPLVNAQALASGISSHDWAPDGSRIVLASGGVLFIADLGTGDLNLVPTAYPVWGPVWSPTGTKIAYSDYSDGDGILTLNVDGSGEKLIRLVNLFRCHCGGICSGKTR